MVSGPNPQSDDKNKPFNIDRVDPRARIPKENQGVQEEYEDEGDAEIQESRQIQPRSPRFNRSVNTGSGLMRAGTGRDGNGETPAGSSRAARKIWGVSIFICALVIAICLDISGLVVEILPGIGGFLAALIITPLGWITLFGFKVMSGKRLGKKSVAIIGICAAIEFIPIINMLPGFTMSVIASQISEAVDNFVEEKQR